MTRIAPFLFSLGLFVSSLTAQTATPPSVQAQGTATIAVAPNQAELTVSMTTNGTTAQDASQQNANLTAAVIAALQKQAGSSGTIQTISYSISPRYNNPTPNQPSVIVGYSATNTIQLTLTNLTLIGGAIDAASQAGATSVNNLTLGLQNPQPSLQSALSAAAKIALANASAIASGLGGKTGAVLSAQQSSSYTPVPVLAVAMAASTPVQTGPISVSATVTVTVALQ